MNQLAAANNDGFAPPFLPHDAVLLPYFTPQEQHELKFIWELYHVLSKGRPGMRGKDLRGAIEHFRNAHRKWNWAISLSEAATPMRFWVTRMKALLDKMDQLRVQPTEARFHPFEGAGDSIQCAGPVTHGHMEMTYRLYNPTQQNHYVYADN